VTTKQPAVVPGPRPAGDGPDRATDLLAVLRAVRVISALTDAAALTAATGEQVKALTGAEHAHVVLRDADGPGWTVQPDGDRITVATSVDDPACAPLAPLSAFWQVARSGEPLVVASALDDDWFAGDPCLAGATSCSLLAVPVTAEGAAEPGAVLVLRSRPGAAAFGRGTLEAVTLLAGQLAVGLATAARFRALEARLEQLTMEVPAEVSDRRRFDEAWAAEWEQGRINSRSVAVLRLDVDDFEAYTHAMGPSAGERCIRAVTAALEDTVRDSDVVCRYAGQGFAIILPRAELRQAFRVAQRAHAAVRALDLSHPGEIGRVTVSVGVAAHVPDGEHDRQHLLAAAEAALHEAKHAGHDQVVAMSPGPLDGD
jgi:diguanylate cyclase (GGDEF)-like protein